jgi:hypothetical protein
VVAGRIQSISWRIGLQKYSALKRWPFERIWTRGKPSWD